MRSFWTAPVLLDDPIQLQSSVATRATSYDAVPFTVIHPDGRDDLYGAGSELVTEFQPTVDN